MNQSYFASLRRAVPKLAALALVAGIAAPAQARDASHKPGARARSASPFNLQAGPQYLMNFNEWLCGLTATGEVCSSAVGSSVGGGGFWPAGTANQYIFNSGLQVGAVIGSEGGAWAGDTVATYFFDAMGGGPGVALTGVYSSAVAEDLAAWPEDCYIDNPVFGRVKTLSQLDTCVKYWDADPTGKHFSDSHPMGLEVTQHSMLWAYPNNKDIMFFIYKFKNVSNSEAFRQRNPEAPAGGYTLTKVYSAFGMDADVSGGEYSQNFATPVPELNLATTWQSDFEAADFVPYAPNFDAAPGFVGVKFLKSPLNNSDAPIRVRIGAEDRTVQPGEQLGMTYFSVNTNGGIMSDPGTARQAFRYLSGNLLTEEKTSWCPDSPPGMCYVALQSAADMRFYQASGPFTLKPGESAEIVVAYVAGAPVPGTYVKGTTIPVGDVMDENRQIEKAMGRGYDQPGFPSLFANARTAQAIFDANFILPSAPKAPLVTVVPGDHENTVIWDASAIEAADPFAQLAQDANSALYDPNFRANDFEGFRVWRKSNPSAEYKLIAQFDIANTIDEEVTVLQKVTTIDGSELIIKADTARVCPPSASGCTPNSGLKFALVDRGGDFPNPQGGPGLTNGMRYYYAVTSFDINSPQSGPNSLESAKVLSGASAGVAAASGVPRKTASGAVAADIGEPELFGGSKKLNPKAAAPAIDPATGVFAGPQPATNAITPEFIAYDALLLEAGKVTATIDSVIPIVGYEDLIPGRTAQTAANCLGASTRYHLTIKSGSVTRQATKEVATPFTLFGCPSRAEAELFNAALTGSASKATELGRDPKQFASAFTAKIDYSNTHLTSGSEAVTVFRSHVLHEENGSYWFSGTPKAEPALGTEQGSLPGVKNIYGLASQYQKNVNVRWQLYLLNTVYRAADIQITWGANGAIDKVFDVTHNVEVPFSTDFKASWGVLQDGSGDGVVSFGDYWMVTPVAEWYCESEGCHTDMANKVTLGPISTVPPRSWGLDPANGANATGFALYIAGEQHMFETDQLPAAGTVWTLRSYAGDVHKGDDGKYAFDAAATRPPTVPGLSFSVDVKGAASFDLAAADLSKVHTVPDPYYVTSKLETGFAAKKLLFVGLPPKATIRVYTLSGVLVAALQHEDAAGSGQLEWDLRSRNDQFLASGVYFYHVEAPNGKEKVGKFTIIQYAQ